MTARLRAWPARARWPSVLRAGARGRGALIIPISHAFGLGCAPGCVARGGTAVLVESQLLARPAPATRSGGAGRPCCTARRALFGRLLVPPRRRSAGIRTGLVAGAPCPPAVLERTGRGRAADPQRLRHDRDRRGVRLRRRRSRRAYGRPRSGAPLPGYEFRVAEGEPGELQVRGPYVMPGYLDRPSRPPQAFDGEWFRTGDLGSIDDGGLHPHRRPRQGASSTSAASTSSRPRWRPFLLTHPDVAQVAVRRRAARAHGRGARRLRGAAPRSRARARASCCASPARRSPATSCPTRSRCWPSCRSDPPASRTARRCWPAASAR